MLNLNYINISIFNLISNTAITSAGDDCILKIVTFVAKKLILIFPLTTIICWFWGTEQQLGSQRIFVCKQSIALLIGLFISGLIRIIFPQARPFMLGFGQYFSLHAPTSSFPSNHCTIAFIFSFSYLFWLRIWIGLILFIIAFMIAWTRIFLGIHWPLDIVGAFFTAIIADFISKIIWKAVGYKLLNYAIKFYHILFSYLIKKGWLFK